MKIEWKHAAVPAVLFLLAIARLAFDPFATSREPERPPPVSREARTMLNGLSLGDRIERFEIARIGGPTDGEIVVELRTSDRGLRVWLTPHGGRTAPPPMRSERFDLYYGPPAPGQTRVSDAECISVLGALAQRIDEP